MNKTLSISSPSLAIALALAASLYVAGPVGAQVAGGTTTTGVTVMETTQLAMGWSVKRTLLGKAIYNDAGAKVGKVEDLIISPERNVTYIIIGAGGFVGIGHHDVAIPVSQIQDQSGKLVMPGATREMIKGMPRFEYANDSARREQFVAAAEKDIAKGKASITELEKKAGASAAEARGKIDQQITAIRVDVKSAEGKLVEMKDAGAKRWKEFEAGVNAATARLRKSVESATA